MSAVPANVQHGDRRSYVAGCRCEPCTHANTVVANRARSSASLAVDCSQVRGEWKGKTSVCIEIASELVQADSDVRRLARLANRSRQAYVKYADELAQAKAARDAVRARRDEHMSECDAAAVRFGEVTA